MKYEDVEQNGAWLLAIVIVVMVPVLLAFGWFIKWWFA